jgi:hypothetical protein
MEPNSTSHGRFDYLSRMDNRHRCVNSGELRNLRRHHHHHHQHPQHDNCRKNGHGKNQLMDLMDLLRLMNLKKCNSNKHHHQCKSRDECKVKFEAYLMELGQFEFMVRFEKLFDDLISEIMATFMYVANLGQLQKDGNVSAQSLATLEFWLAEDLNYFETLRNEFNNELVNTTAYLALVEFYNNLGFKKLTKEELKTSYCAIFTLFKEIFEVFTCSDTFLKWLLKNTDKLKQSMERITELKFENGNKVYEELISDKNRLQWLGLFSKLEHPSQPKHKCILPHLIKFFGNKNSLGNNSGGIDALGFDKKQGNLKHLLQQLEALGGPGTDIRCPNTALELIRQFQQLGDSNLTGDLPLILDYIICLGLLVACLCPTSNTTGLTNLLENLDNQGDDAVADAGDAIVSLICVVITFGLCAGL